MTDDTDSAAPEPATCRTCGAALGGDGLRSRVCPVCTDHGLAFWDEYAVLGDGGPARVGVSHR